MGEYRRRQLEILRRVVVSFIFSCGVCDQKESLIFNYLKPQSSQFLLEYSDFLEKFLESRFLETSHKKVQLFICIVK